MINNIKQKTETPQVSSKSIARDALIREWSLVYEKPLSEEEYLEISQNLTAFLHTLYSWNKPK